MKRLLLLGKNGQLGREISRQCTSHEVSALGREDLDVTDIASLQRTVRKLRPSIVINAAAYTAVDRAETQPQEARIVNALVPKALAQECLEAGSLLVHFSTDYVFDGSKGSSYSEEDATAPLNQYGRSKLEGELAIRGSGAKHLIFRTSWIFSEFGHNFLKTMLKLAAEREEVNVVCDQRGCPTASADLAACVLATMLRADDSAQLQGTYHATGAGPASWADFAESIFESAFALGMIASRPRVKRIHTSEYPTAAIRPLDSRLDNSKLRRNFGLQLPPWPSSMQSVLRAIHALAYNESGGRV